MTAWLRKSRLNLSCCAIVALLAFALGGCREVIKNGDETIFQLVWWVKALAIVGPLAGLALCIYAIKTRYKVAHFTLVFIGMLMFLIVGTPMVWRDAVHVTPQGIVQKTGYWWHPEEEKLDFESLESVTLGTKPKQVHFHTEDGPTWEVKYKDGKSRQIVILGVWAQFEGELIARLQEQGIRVTNSRH